MIIMVSPRLSGLTTVVESELVDIRIDCSNPQSSWLPNIGRGLFQCFIAQRTQKFGRANRTEIPFWKLIFTGIFHPKMLPHGLWEEYMVFKNKFQDMMLDKSIRKVEEDDEDALAYIKEVYGLKEIVPTEIDRMVKAISEEPAPKMKRGRGRPKGAKDSYKRVRKRKQSNKSA